jgi:Ca-activated chloride channel family protein
LFPYFEQLPSLGRAEFESLATFAGSIGKSPPATQNLVLGEWYSLVDLIARGVKAGSLDAAAGAQAFRRVCEGLGSTDHSELALATLREIAGGAADVNEAVPARLLRLSGAQRSAYDRIMELQSVPHLDAASAADPAKTVAALSGFVYAASLDPDALLINEDPHVLSRHQFFAAENPAKRAVFSQAALMGRNQPPGTFIRGGFTNFDQIAHGLARAGGGVLQSLPSDSATSQPGNAASSPSAPGVAGSAPPEEARFSADGRLVEVWATVTDSRGHYMDNLSADQFTISEKQQTQPVVAFESRVSPVSVALLLDTTGSMQAALPALKNAAMKLMGDLRAGDSVAVYSFNSSVTELQPFTTDMAAAKRAVLRTQALGETALYDALARVSRDLAGRPGKKVIVVFTDGNDNSSTLTTDTAILRAKATGVPVYTIAQGEALQFPAFVKQLADVSKATGGESFVIQNPNEIGAVFEKVSEELTHGYLLTFSPPSAQDRAFHPIDLTVQTKGLKPRFREGYYPQ